ncbi:hypothetical protein I4F81_004148 [Pyropia yezoensis]|uniref:Uncharacterized protein n=1 Tax=Pyropia yezoensis TaxID=2788 RepID=A0ACC3BUL2_PYRYE|nr:hypothetical protein I4F81_004148 [Neopyropia yezoensis]
MVLPAVAVDAGSTVSRVAQVGPSSTSDGGGAVKERPPAVAGPSHPRAACSTALPGEPTDDSAAQDSTLVRARAVVVDGGAAAHDSTQGIGRDADGHGGSAAPDDTPPGDGVVVGNGDTAAHEDMLAREAAVDGGPAAFDSATAGGGDAVGDCVTVTHDSTLGGGRVAADDGGTADVDSPPGGAGNASGEARHASPCGRGNVPDDGGTAVHDSQSDGKGNAVADCGRAAHGILPGVEVTALDDGGKAPHDSARGSGGGSVDDNGTAARTSMIGGSFDAVCSGVSAIAPTLGCGKETGLRGSRVQSTLERESNSFGSDAAAVPNNALEACGDGTAARRHIQITSNASITGHPTLASPPPLHGQNRQRLIPFLFLFRQT